MFVIPCTLMMSGCFGEKEPANSLTFYVDGNSYHQINLANFETAVLPDAPTKEGYIFQGWYTEENGGGVLVDNIQEDILVYEALSNTMAPEINLGDRVRVEPTGDYEIGDVVCYQAYEQRAISRIIGTCYSYGDLIYIVHNDNSQSCNKSVETATWEEDAQYIRDLQNGGISYYQLRNTLRNCDFLVETDIEAEMAQVFSRKEGMKIKLYANWIAE